MNNNEEETLSNVHKTILKVKLGALIKSKNCRSNLIYA